jgi:hypothetical protein
MTLGQKPFSTLSRCRTLGTGLTPSPRHPWVSNCIHQSFERWPYTASASPSTPPLGNAPPARPTMTYLGTTRSRVRRMVSRSPSTIGYGDVLFQAAQTAALAPGKERRDLFPYDNDRPADVYIPMWAEGRDAALDVTVTSPLQAAQLHRAAAHAGAALDAAKSRKMSKSFQKCWNAGIMFLPLPVETFGGWDFDAIVHFRKLGRQLARHSSTDEATTTKHLFQRLSIFLQRGNATLLLGRRPHYAPPDLVGPD